MHRGRYEQIVLAVLFSLLVGLGCAARSGDRARFSAFPPAAVGSWGQVLTLNEGSRVLVTLTGGETIEGRLRSAGESGLTVERDHSAGATMVAKTDVAVVRTKPLRDSTLNGLLIGAGVGAGAGAGIGAGVSQRIDVKTSITVPILAAAGAGAGAIVGYLIDRSRPADTVVYRAP